MVQRVDKDSLKLDQPRRTPGHPTKSHIVKTRVDGKEKIIRFGEQGAETAGKPKEGESERMKTKRASFKARHAKNIAKGKSSPAYWANKVKWADGGPVTGMAVGGGWGQMAAAGPVKGAAAVTARDDRAAPGTYIGTGVRGFTYDAGDPELGIRPSVRLNGDDVAPGMRDLARSYGVDDGEDYVPASLTQPVVAVRSAAPIAEQPTQAPGFFAQLLQAPKAIGQDLMMGYRAGIFSPRDVQEQNLLRAEYTPAAIADYFARTDATRARMDAAAPSGIDRSEAMPAQGDLAQAFAREYNIVGRNRSQLMPLLEAFLRGRGITDPSTYADNIFNTLSIPMQQGGAVELNEIYQKYMPFTSDRDMIGQMERYLENIRRAQGGADEQAKRERDVVIGAFAPPPRPTPNDYLREKGATPEIEGYRQAAIKAAEKYGIPPNIFLSLVRTESNFNPLAKSGKGAMGLVQLMPKTAEELGVTDPFDPMQNLDGGARYLAQQYNRFGEWPLALSAYNAGASNVLKYDGIPPFEETKNYVDKVMRGAGILKYADGGAVPPMQGPKGFASPERLAAMRQYDEEMRVTPEDLDAAGYTPSEIDAYYEFREPRPSLSQADIAQMAEKYGTLQPADPTLRQRTGDVLSGAMQDYLGMDNYYANKYARRIVGDPGAPDFLSSLGLADLTGLAAPFAMQEGARTFERGLETDDYLTAGMGALEAGLGAVEAIPYVGLAAKGAGPAARFAVDNLMNLERMLTAYDPNVLGSNLGNVGGRRPPRGPGGGEPPEVPPEATSVAPRASVVGSSAAYRDPGDAQEAARRQVLDIAAARSEDPGKARVKIEDIANFHQQNHLAQHGRQLDPFNDDDFNLGVKAAADEVRYQLGQSVSGKGWYDSDVQKTFEIASRVPGLEDLATNETDRVIMSAIMAPTSIGQIVAGNTRAAIAAMRQYKKTGEIPTTPPAPGSMTEGIQNAGWGLKQQSVAAGMRVINHLVNKFGPDGFADWWLSPHTLKEMTELRKEAGLSGPPSGLSGGNNSMHLGAMILGDKTGRFSLNINGYEGTTKDVWFSRSYNRHFGNMFDNAGEVQGGPRNATERRRMEEFTRKMRDDLKDQGLSEQDIQAILWYYEQNLMTDLGVPSRPGAFSEEAERIYGNLRPAVRAGDEAEAAAEPRGLEGFRGISPTQRAVRAERRLSGGSNVADLGGPSGPYERGIGSGDEGDGLLVLTPRADSLARYQAAGLNVPTIREVPAQQAAAQYNADMTEAMKGHKFGAQVEIKSPEDLAQARLFRTEDGSGFAIKPDGDIVAVFAGKGSAKGSAYSMLQAAVAAGGRKLDAFDTYLPKIYETAGFRPVARLPWNDEFAPPDWDKKTFAKYNGGEPDVVFFVYDPNYFGGAKNVPVFDDYGDAVAEQERVLQSMMAPAPVQRARGGSISIEDLAGKYDIGGRGYARGGTVRAQPKGYAAGGLVTPFDPAMIDQIVNRVKGAARV